MNGLASADQQLAALETFYQSQLELARKNGLDITLLTAVYEESMRKKEQRIGLLLYKNMSWTLPRISEI